MHWKTCEVFVLNCISFSRNIKYSAWYLSTICNKRRIMIKFKDFRLPSVRKWCSVLLALLISEDLRTVTRKNNTRSRRFQWAADLNFWLLPPDTFKKGLHTGVGVVLNGRINVFSRLFLPAISKSNWLPYLLFRRRSGMFKPIRTTGRPVHSKLYRNYYLLCIMLRARSGSSHTVIYISLAVWVE